MRLSGSAAKIESEEVTTASVMVRRGGTGINTVLIHDTGWVKVPVQFLALAVVAKAENNQNSLKLPACSCVSITLPALL